MPDIQSLHHNIKELYSPTLKGYLNNHLTDSEFNGTLMI